MNTAASGRPVVTVAMPVYNAGRFLRPALQSILLQDFPDWELLLIDDGSTDEALSGIADLTADSRIRVLCDARNKGLAARLNEAIDLAQGEYIARMDQDDIAYPARFARQIEFLSEHSSVDLVACRCLRISEHDVAVGEIPYELTHEKICARAWRGIHLAHPAWMGRTAWFRKHRYAQPGPYCSEDQELLLRAAADSRYAIVPQVLLAYRVRATLPWRKTLRTRGVLWGIQWRHFVRRGPLHFAVLLTLAFALSVMRDGLNVLLRRAPHDNGSPELDVLAGEFSSVLREASR